MRSFRHREETLKALTGQPPKNKIRNRKQIIKPPTPFRGQDRGAISYNDAGLHNIMLKVNT